MTELLGVGAHEVMFVAILALTLIGPRRATRDGRALAAKLRELRDYASSIRDEIHTEYTDLRGP